jgi:hypothetical protein
MKDAVQTRAKRKTAALPIALSFLGRLLNMNGPAIGATWRW